MTAPRRSYGDFPNNLRRLRRIQRGIVRTKHLVARLRGAVAGGRRAGASW
jgi:hypothetical protein